MLHHGFDQRMAPARNDHVEIAIHLREEPDPFAVGEGHQLDDIRRETRVLRPGGKRFGDGEVRMDRFFPPAEDAGIARLEAQDGGIRGHVGAGFVNDADHTDGHAKLGDFESVRAGPRTNDFPDRIGEQCDLPHTLGHGKDPLGCKAKAVDGRGVESVIRGRGEVFGIGRNNFAFRGLDGVGHGLQGCILGVGRAKRQGTGGEARAPAHLLDL